MLFQFVESDGVLDHFDDAAIGTHGEHLIGSEDERKALQFEDVVELVDELKRKLLLLEVVASLYHQMDQSPGRKVLIDGLLLDPLGHVHLILSEHLVELLLHFLVAEALHLHVLLPLFEQARLRLHLIRILQQLVRQVLAVFLVEDFSLRRIAEVALLQA